MKIEDLEKVRKLDKRRKEIESIISFLTIGRKVCTLKVSIPCSSESKAIPISSQDALDVLNHMKEQVEEELKRI